MRNFEIFSETNLGSVRAAMKDEQPLFVAKDVATILGYKNVSSALKRHVDKEDIVTTKIQTAQGMQNTMLINESGMYALIFASHLDTAKAFKSWVTKTILPSLRKHGGYILGQENVPENTQEELLKQLEDAQKEIESLNGKLSMWDEVKTSLASEYREMMDILKDAKLPGETDDFVVCEDGLLIRREFLKGGK